MTPRFYTIVQSVALKRKEIPLDEIEIETKLSAEIQDDGRRVNLLSAQQYVSAGLEAARKVSIN